MQYADRHPHIARLRVASILSGAVRLYRVSPARVAGASLVVLLPLVLVSEGFHELELTLDPATLHDRLFLFTVLPTASEVLALLGLVVLGGVMDELVGALIRGTREPTLAQAIRALPLGRLILADVVVVMLIGLGTLVGRSVRLTRPHAWLALCIVVPAVLLESVIHGFLLVVWNALGLVGELAVEIPLILSLGAMVVLAEVVLAYALMARDTDSVVAQMVRDAVGPGEPVSEAGPPPT
jgi:hypothetical protein